MGDQIERFQENVTKASQQIYDELRKYWLGILDEKPCFEIAAASMEAFLKSYKLGSYSIKFLFAKHGVPCNNDMARKIFSEIFYKPIENIIYNTRIGKFQFVDDYGDISIEAVEGNTTFEFNRELPRCF